MGWRRGGRGRIGPWSGRGPFSCIPPWQRPGWLFGYGRGSRYGYCGVGYGRGLGYGRGMGYGYGYIAPYRAAYPGYVGYPSPGYSRVYPYYEPSLYPRYW